tara:strand:+ start:7632 stop:8246 length:615 start_codon:yes stop_codon:yes gene_type:complete
MAAAQSPAQEVQEVRCLTVSGITGLLGYLNGTYHEEPEHSDGVPCYRKYCSRGASQETITRRGGYWFFDVNHRERSDGFNNDGCGVRYDNPKDVARWFLEVNGDCFGTAVVKVEEASAPYQGCAPGWPVGYWYDESWSDEEEGYYEEEYENDELPEDNTEKAKEIKDAVKAVGEQVFDIQDQLKEGDYLKLMNLLQQVTNKVNS